MPDTPLLVIPFSVTNVGYSLMIVLQEGNIDRIREYDPAVVVMRELPPDMGQLVDVVVTFATTEDAAFIEECGRTGRISEALKRLTRGYRFRPDLGDHDGGPTLLGSHKST